MSETITIAADPLKQLIYYGFNKDFAAFARRYFNFGEELSNEIFHTVVDEYYLKVKAGELELWDNAQRQLEKIGTQEMIKFLRNRLPGLTVEAVPAD